MPYAELRFWKRILWWCALCEVHLAGPVRIMRDMDKLDAREVLP